MQDLQRQYRHFGAKRSGDWPSCKYAQLATGNLQATWPRFRDEWIPKNGRCMGCHKSLVLSQVSAKMAILLRYRVVNPSSNSTSSWSMWCHWRYSSSHVTRYIDQDIRSFTCVYHLHRQLDFQIPKKSIFEKDVADNEKEQAKDFWNVWRIKFPRGRFSPSFFSFSGRIRCDPKRLGNVNMLSSGGGIRR